MMQERLAAKWECTAADLHPEWMTRTRGRECPWTLV
jgi:hypothetical protein